MGGLVPRRRWFLALWNLCQLLLALAIVYAVMASASIAFYAWLADDWDIFGWIVTRI